MKRCGIVLCLLLSVCLSLCACGPGVPDTRPPHEEIPTQVLGTVLQELVYADASGYLVPTARRVARTEDCTALLKRLTNGEFNAAFFDETGLHGVLPVGFDVSANLVSGVCHIDITGEWQTLSTADERILVRGVVATALALPGVEGARLTFNGQELKTLANQTVVSQVFRAMVLNMDTSVCSDVDRGYIATLYFGGTERSLLVPVGRVLPGAVTLASAVSQLCRGPSSTSKLCAVMPTGTSVLSAAIEDGIATVNFSAAFANIAAMPDNGVQCARAVILTCMQFPGVDAVRFQVEGQPFETDLDMSVGSFANAF